MNFGEKLRLARIAQNLSQTELAQKAGVTERSIYRYEQLGKLPRSAMIKQLAQVLNVPVTYLMDEEETDQSKKGKEGKEELFLVNAKNKFGSKGAREAQAVISQASVLFAGSELNDEAKDIFFQSLMEVYLESKAEASEKFSARRRISRKK